MRKYLVTAAMIALLALAAIAFFLWDQPLLALASLVVAVALWVLGPSPVGHVPPQGERGEKLDPAELKQYRRDHPGSTIGDAVRASQDSPTDRSV